MNHTYTLLDICNIISITSGVFLIIGFIIKTFSYIYETYIITKIDIKLTTIGKSKYFIISNNGKNSIYDLTVESINNCHDLLDCREEIISLQYLNLNFPCKELKPHHNKKLLAGIHLNSPTKFIITIKYKNMWHITCYKEFDF